jgi:hypothetical protein
MCKCFILVDLASNNNLLPSAAFFLCPDLLLPTSCWRGREGGREVGMMIIMGCVIHHHVGIEQTDKQTDEISVVGGVWKWNSRDVISVDGASKGCLSGFEGTKQALISKAERAAVGTY